MHLRGCSCSQPSSPKLEGSQARSVGTQQHFGGGTKALVAPFVCRAPAQHAAPREGARRALQLCKDTEAGLLQCSSPCSPGERLALLCCLPVPSVLQCSCLKG